MTEPVRVVVVSGLSGAGKLSVLRALEDIGFEAVDNPPLTMLGAMVGQAQRSLAVGVDARTSGFDPGAVVNALNELRADPRLRPELIYCWAEEAVLLRRYSETRRRHPLAPSGRVSDGIAEEQALTAPLREAADLVLDTSDLPLAAMRALIERRYGAASAGEAPRMAIALLSFSYAHGLPRDADLVFDARFLRNPHYDPILQPKTGLDADVAAYVEADPDFPAYMRMIEQLLDLLLPRFIQEGKKYVTIAVGCTGGRHRSVRIVERLANHLRGADGDADGRWWLHVAHRELARLGASGAFPRAGAQAGQGGNPMSRSEAPRASLI
ncbi:MAG TPA: RNase adapter RapZ [Acetobacteraceae bacterium]|nr:RNase adapter RapZ [Acetobacteraceae bacterium]